MAIPAIIHQTAASAMLPRWCQELVDRVRWLHPNWEHRFYDDTACRELVAAARPDLLDVYDSYGMAIQRADMFRVVALQAVGGFYLDVDIECHRPLDDLLASACVLGEELTLTRHAADALGHADTQRIANYVLGAESGHMFLEDVVDEMTRRAGRVVGSDDDVLESTGPGLLTTVYHRAKARHPDVVVVPNGDVICRKCRRASCQFGGYATHLHVGSWRGGAAPAPDAGRRPRVNLHANFFDGGGMGRHARAFGAALGAHAEVALCPATRAPDPGSEPDDVDLHFSAAPFVDGVDVSFGPLAFLPATAGAARIVATVSETSRVPGPYIDCLRSASEVWVPTEWGRRILVDGGLADDRVVVVPEGVDAHVFRPAPLAADRSAFRFVCVGKWEERKNQRALVTAFAREFGPDEPVELVLHCRNVYYETLPVDRLVAEMLCAAGRAVAPVIVDDGRSLDGLVRLLQSADAFVLPTRGEAWGLPILEAMACGLPCIVTDYSGHRSYANDANSYLIEVERMVPVHDPLFFAPDLDWGEWAEPSGEHLQYLMRHVFEHREEAAQRGRVARRDAEQWPWDRAARDAIARLPA